MPKDRAPRGTAAPREDASGAMSLLKLDGPRVRPANLRTKPDRLSDAWFSEASDETLEPSDATLSRLATASAPEKAVVLAFVDLAGAARPASGQAYNLVVASEASLASLATPTTEYARLDLDLYAFYLGDLPDFGANEGLVRVKVDTRNPQDLDEKANATRSVEFRARDFSYAPGFLYRGVFRNILFQEFVNLSFDLYELDKDGIEYYDKIKKVINDVPELGNLDVLQGIPYLNVASKLFEGIVKTFGVNPDDHLWGEIPILERDPLVGGAFLRSGIYVILQKEFSDGNRTDAVVDLSQLRYKDGRVVLQGTNQSVRTTHLVFGLRLREYQPTGV